MLEMRLRKTFIISMPSIHSFSCDSVLYVDRSALSKAITLRDFNKFGTQFLENKRFDGSEYGQKVASSWIAALCSDQCRERVSFFILLSRFSLHYYPKMEWNVNALIESNSKRCRYPFNGTILKMRFYK